MRKQLVKGILILFSFSLASLAALISIGFTRYQLLINEKPLNDAIAEIQSSPNYVTLDEVNDEFIQALLAIEDPTFYEHHGIVLANILEAISTNVKAHGLVMGGSTITQQLSKNIYLDQKKTFQRKITELFFVHDLETNYTKDEILELYINIIYFGDGYYGIKEACAGYFHSDPKSITIAQATILAGLPQAPALYQLSDGLTYAKQRQRRVLEAMEKQKLISSHQAQVIYDQPL